ncbi:Mu-like prophage major head subunit gpT family protein [Celeribacter sp.]|uniref:Mu-like prophage major head subunit gpT family protein n=1 Tax=Celeribacter sp. TaxID=1890673 RepID=UPI003A8ECB14
MAIITAAVLAALRTSLRKEFRTGYEGMQPKTFWNTVAMLAPSTSSSNTYDWLGDFPELTEWVGERVVKDMKENGYQIVNKLFESTVGVKRTAIEDDEAGLYSNIVLAAGQSAARFPDQLIANLLKAGGSSLCYDGQNFFDTDHPVFPNADGTGAAATISNMATGAGRPWYLLDCSVEAKPFIFQERTKPEFDTLTDSGQSDTVFLTDRYLYGTRYRCNAGYGFWQKAYMSTEVLSDDTLDAAIAAMMGFKGDGDRPLGISPTHLVVDPTNRATGNKVVKAINRANGESNTNYEAVELIVTPWLA